jgi:hypothetical protein
VLTSDNETADESWDCETMKCPRFWGLTSIRGY